MRLVRNPPSLLFGLLCLLSFSPMGQAAEQDSQLNIAREMVKVLEAYAVYKMGQYDLAFERYTELAESGSTTGMYNLANMYSDGLGVDQDPQKAFHWYLKAAEAGNVLSMHEVASAFDSGLGVMRDPAKARFWRDQARAADE